jgi:ketosteroid isomerase-like protein
MHDPATADFARHVRGKNEQIMAMYAAGQIRKAVERFYTSDIRYVTPDGDLLIGHESVTAFFEEIRKSFRAVRFDVLETFCAGPGDSCYCQIVNAVLEPSNGGDVAIANYVALFRFLGGEWYCAMERSAWGQIKLTTSR